MGRGARPRRVPGQEGRHLFLVLAPGRLPQFPVLTTLLSLSLFFRGFLLCFQIPGALGLQVPPASWYPLPRAVPLACPRCPWVPLHSFGTLQNKSAPADSSDGETERLWSGTWRRRRPGVFARTGDRDVSLPPRPSGRDASPGVRWLVLSARDDHTLGGLGPGSGTSEETVIRQRGGVRGGAEVMVVEVVLSEREKDITFSSAGSKVSSWGLSARCLWLRIPCLLQLEFQTVCPSSRKPSLGAFSSDLWGKSSSVSQLRTRSS